ncbi:hypothetical protein BP5796_02301 [Coleophoma crateriformis]|uniref:C2 domain-containing protein n=1 Tax=Coleophoma crateriformis TaxID=565419 RepID=A0A3D8SXV3_9HELO|nr:hypothetical protein BP5796_02301 [Coleophoma crateriformis]
MASKSKMNGLNGVHTSGIFADMTVDGPEIGTLVVIVDRAKNLPNRKTMGKQDPYCAARLGKEAKKTETDRRGGQTPRWDQELRFTVHDSPDYYQLKVSVFNDDKKTEIIGETWVDLKEVVVPGGGTNDIWHNLSFKGKYAGEIRIEITYYDTRPKEEKALRAKGSGSTAVQESPRDTLSGPRQPKTQTPVKRRPLPSDPITGASVSSPAQPPAPAPAAAAPPEHVQTPPRAHQNVNYIQEQSPLQRVEYNTPPHRFSQSQGYGQSPSSRHGYEQSPRNHGSYTQSPRYDHGYSKSAGNVNGYGNSGTTAPAPSAQQIPIEQYDSFDPGNGYSSGMGSSYEDEPHMEPHDLYKTQHALYDLPPPDEYDGPPSPDGPPPPPPAHGSKHVSPLPPMASHDSYGFPNTPTRQQDPYAASPQDITRSLPAYSQPKSYQAYSPPKEDDHFSRPGTGYQQSPPHSHSFDTANNDYQSSPPRHRSYDSGYDNHASMQPTVEDAPPTPSPLQSNMHRGSFSHSQQYDNGRYDQVPSPAPLNLSGRGSAASGRNSAVSSAPSHQISNSPYGYNPTGSDLSYRDQSSVSSFREQSSVSSFRDQSTVSSRTSYNPLPQYNQLQQRQSEDPMTASAIGYGMPPVPTSLVAGMDPDIAKEISDRIYNEKRASQSAGNSPRGRPIYQDSPHHQTNQNRAHPLSYHEAALTPFVPAVASHDDQQSRYSTGTVAPIVKPRAISPDPRVPARKSVSPAPAPASSETRRLSGVPFGPDSYNALNPALAGSTSTTSLSERYDPKDNDPDAKIITHDGREIDPSDHIPESNYAPLLEKKGPKYASQLPDRNYRPPGSQPVSSTGRRQLKVAPARPQSMGPTASGPVFSGGYSDPPPPTNGRNRLQKRTNRMSAQPAPHSSPLTAITPYQDNSFAPRSLPRANTGDFAGENYPSNYGGSPGYRGTANGPPPPAKVPINNYNPGPAPSSHSGADAWTLLDEMKNIDLGTGRSRRRGY